MAVPDHCVAAPTYSELEKMSGRPRIKWKSGFFDSIIVDTWSLNSRKSGVNEKQKEKKMEKTEILKSTGERWKKN